MTHRLSLVVAFISFVNLIPLATRVLADVDPAMVGTWETSGVNAYGPWKLSWEIRPDGAYFLSGAISDSGIVGAGDGRWHTHSNVTNQSADGTYSMSDLNHMFGTGPLGSAAWTRVAGPLNKQAPSNGRVVSAQLGEGNLFEDISPEAGSASSAPTRALTQEEKDATNDYIILRSKNDPAARAQLEKHAQSGVASAQALLAMQLEQENKFPEAVSWYRKAAEQGDGEAMSHLGQCYWSGHGVERSVRDAISWWKQAANKGNQEAGKNLKMALEKFDESGAARMRK
jgi:hypothetical protein